MNLAYTCRTCLQSTMDEPVKITASIYDFLEDLQLQRIPRVHPQLELPQSVCFDCYRNLIAFKRFFAQCRDAEEYFRMKLEKVEQEWVQSQATESEDNGSAIEEDNKIYHLTKEANSDILDLIENCEGEDEVNEIQDNTYVGENSNRLCTDFEFEASKFQNNVDSNMGSEVEELEYKHLDSTEYIDDNEQNSLIKVQYDECFEAEIENKTNEILLVLDDESNNQIEYENHNLTEKSIKIKKRYQCQYCDKSFSSRYDLQMHENIHNGIKPFTCNICGKNFSQKNILRTHETLHFGKTIKCRECGKTFARKSQLILHDRMHRNEKPFVCDYDDSCGAAFRERQHLLAHQKIHSGLREYQCHLCPSAFYHRKGLLAHIRDIHGSICYQCDLCERSFNKPYKIRRHMHSVHNVQLTDVSQLKKNVCSKDYSENADVPIIYEED